MSDTKNGKYIFFRYDPSLAAAIVMVALFALVTAVHTFQLVRKRTWYFIPFVIGGLFEVVGYIGRILASQQSPNWTTGPYVMQSLLLLLAPALFAASMYMILRRIILLTGGEHCSVVPTKWLTKIFVGGDVLSFLTQSAGGGIQASAKGSNNTVQVGEDVVLAGLGIQIFFFGFFIVVAAIFHTRITRAPTTRSQATKLPWQRYLLVLYVGSSLIMVRSMFRIVEYGMGQDGVLLSTEVFLYVFDGALMFINMILFIMDHPGAIITKSSMEGAKNQDLEGLRGEFQPSGTGYKMTYEPNQYELARK